MIDSHDSDTRIWEDPGRKSSPDNARNCQTKKLKGRDSSTFCFTTSTLTNERWMSESSLNTFTYVIRSGPLPSASPVAWPIILNPFLAPLSRNHHTSCCASVFFIVQFCSALLPPFSSCKFAVSAITQVPNKTQWTQSHGKKKMGSHTFL